jgi:hypothetical protein
MGSLIDGYFLLHDPRPFDKEHDDPPIADPSSQQDRSYLTVYNTCAPLGMTLKAEKTFEAEIRLFSEKSITYDNQVLYIHGQFDITVNDGIRYLRIDAHRFILIGDEKALDQVVPPEVHTNVSFFGRAVVSNQTPVDPISPHFAIEVNVFVRGFTRTYTILFVTVYIFHYHLLIHIIQLQIQQKRPEKQTLAQHERT